MGSFNTTCIATGISIKEGDPVMMVLLTENNGGNSRRTMCHPHSLYKTASCFFTGKYSGYGWLKDIVCNDEFAYNMELFECETIEQLEENLYRKNREENDCEAKRMHTAFVHPKAFSRASSLFKKDYAASNEVFISDLKKLWPERKSNELKTEKYNNLEENISDRIVRTALLSGHEDAGHAKKSRSAPAALLIGERNGFECVDFNSIVKSRWEIIRQIEEVPSSEWQLGKISELFIGILCVDEYMRRGNRLWTPSPSMHDDDYETHMGALIEDAEFVVRTAETDLSNYLKTLD